MRLIRDIEREPLRCRASHQATPEGERGLSSSYHILEDKSHPVTALAALPLDFDP
jgi:hypothetical protein